MPDKCLFISVFSNITTCCSTTKGGILRLSSLESVLLFTPMIVAMAVCVVPIFNGATI